MTVAWVLTWSVCRAALVSTAALPLSASLNALLYRASGRRSGLLAAAAFLPLFVPDLLTGFTYRLMSLKLLHSAAATEMLYGVLLLCKVTALQAVARFVLPLSAVDRQAVHSWKLLRRRSTGWLLQYLRLLAMGPWRPSLVCWLAGILVCFQEFEAAALMQVQTYPVAWTVWLFDAQAQGESLSVSLGYIMRAAAVQLAILCPLLWLIPHTRYRPENRRRGLLQTARADSTTVRNSAVVRAVATVWICISAGVLVIWPVLSNLPGVAAGMSSLFEQKMLMRRVLDVSLSVLPAMSAAAAALWITWLMRQRGLRWLTVLLMLPGLCGSLFISLVLQSLFQLPGLHLLYDTPVPMLAGLTLFALPRAWLLIVLLETGLSESSLYSAELLRRSADAAVARTARALLWRFRELPWWAAFSVLSYWCFWDVTIVFTLHPIGFEHVVTRLYNEMHYGRSEALLAGTLLSLLIPGIICFLIAVVWRTGRNLWLPLNHTEKPDRQNG